MEVWVDGFAFLELSQRQEALAQQKEELERQKKMLTKRKPASTSSSQTSESCAVSQPSWLQSTDWGLFLLSRQSTVQQTAGRGRVCQASSTNVCGWYCGHHCTVSALCVFPGPLTDCLFRSMWRGRKCSN